MPAPVVEYIAPAPAMSFVAPAPSVYATPAPVVEYVASAPAVSFMVPAPVVKYIVHLRLPCKYVASAPDVIMLCQRQWSGVQRASASHVLRDASSSCVRCDSISGGVQTRQRQPLSCVAPAPAVSCRAMCHWWSTSRQRQWRILHCTSVRRLLRDAMLKPHTLRQRQGSEYIAGTPAVS